MAGNGNADQVANSIISEALKNAGVPAREINLTPEPPVVPVVKTVEPVNERKTKLDGSLKGQVKGELMEEQEPDKDDVTDPDKVPPTEPKPAEQHSKEDIAALIDQASVKFQSIMDRKIFALNTQTQQIASALNQFFESQDNASFNGLPPEEQVLQRIKRLEEGGQRPKIQLQQPVAVNPVAQSTYQLFANLVDSVGLKIDDKRIDWSPELPASEMQTINNRFAASLKKALVEDQTKIITELKNSGEKEIGKIRKKSGVDRLSTSGAGGAGLPNVDGMTPFQKLEYASAQEAQANKT